MSEIQYHNNIFHKELSWIMNQLEDFKIIDKRLGYDSPEKAIFDDVEQIKTAILWIYNEKNETVDWELIEVLKIKLKKISNILLVLLTKKENKQYIQTSTIQNVRNLVEEIWELKMSSGEVLRINYNQDIFWEIAENWENTIGAIFDWIVDFIKNLEYKEEASLTQRVNTWTNDFITLVPELWIQFQEKSLQSFENLDTRSEIEDFILNAFMYILDFVVGGKKFKIAWRFIPWVNDKGEILDDILEAWWELVELALEYWIVDKIAEIYAQRMQEYRNV